MHTCAIIEAVYGGSTLSSTSFITLIEHCTDVVLNISKPQKSSNEISLRGIFSTEEHDLPLPGSLKQHHMISQLVRV